MQLILNNLSSLAASNNDVSNNGARIQQTYLSNVSSIIQNVAGSQGEILNEETAGRNNQVSDTPEVIGQKVTQDVNDGFTDGLADGYFGGRKNRDQQS